MKKITLYIPEHQRLGQALMNAYRDQWYNPDFGENHNYWNIWEHDTDKIQQSITKKMTNTNNGCKHCTLLCLITKDKRDSLAYGVLAFFVAVIVEFILYDWSMMPGALSFVFLLISALHLFLYLLPKLK